MEIRCHELNSASHSFWSQTSFTWCDFLGSRSFNIYWRLAMLHFKSHYTLFGLVHNCSFLGCRNFEIFLSSTFKLHTWHKKGKTKTVVFLSKLSSSTTNDFVSPPNKIRLLHCLRRICTNWSMFRRSQEELDWKREYLTK